jgi:ABC-type multidrug transport system fused ATPase/permease subunit
VIWLTMHGQNAFINTDSTAPAAAGGGRADHRDPAAAVRLGRAPDPLVGAGPAAIPVADPAIPAGRVAVPRSLHAADRLVGFALIWARAGPVRHRRPAAPPVKPAKPLNSGSEHIFKPGSEHIFGQFPKMCADPDFGRKCALTPNFYSILSSSISHRIYLMANYVYTMNRVGKIVPPKRQILKDISLSFFPGAKIGVLGLNGSGKSTC